MCGGLSPATSLATCKLKATGGKWSRQSFDVGVPAGTHKLTFVMKGGTGGMLLKNFRFE